MPSPYDQYNPILQRREALDVGANMFNRRPRSTDAPRPAGPTGSIRACCIGSAEQMPEVTFRTLVFAGSVVLKSRDVPENPGRVRWLGARDAYEVALDMAAKYKSDVHVAAVARPPEFAEDVENGGRAREHARASGTEIRRAGAASSAGRAQASFRVVTGIQPSRSFVQPRSTGSSSSFSDIAGTAYSSAGCSARCRARSSPTRTARSWSCVEIALRGERCACCERQRTIRQERKYASSGEPTCRLMSALSASRASPISSRSIHCTSPPASPAIAMPSR